MCQRGRCEGAREGVGCSWMVGMMSGRKGMEEGERSKTLKGLYEREMEKCVEGRRLLVVRYLKGWICHLKLSCSLSYSAKRLNDRQGSL